jgi:hypothetical protein
VSSAVFVLSARFDERELEVVGLRVVMVGSLDVSNSDKNSDGEILDFFSCWFSFDSRALCHDTGLETPWPTWWPVEEL